MPTWDETKLAPVVAWDDDRVAYGELRINLLGWLQGCVVHMTYTERADDFHVISLRKAVKHEVNYYISQITH